MKTDDPFEGLDQDPMADAMAELGLTNKKSMEGRFTDAKSALDYMMAGKATVTLKSLKTSTRFTYKLTFKESDRPGSNGVTFVALMNGPDNTADFQYMGHIFNDQGVYHHGKKSKVSWDAPGAKAFIWAHRQLSQGKMPDVLEVWHSGT